MRASMPSVAARHLGLLVASSLLLQQPHPCESTNTTLGAKPASQWPGANVTASNGAWVAGKQPTSLEVWLPKTADGNPAPCWKATALSDVAAGWPGKCNEMSLNADFGDEAACRSRCITDIFCSTWLWSISGCYQGKGVNCYGGGGVFNASAGQRVQHGDVIVLKDMSAYDVQNLKNIGIFSSVPAKVGAQRCKFYCYSDIRCQYWQYGDAGCSVEDPDYATVQYPLTTTGGAVASSTIFAGEFLQRVCPKVEVPAMVGGTSYFLIIGAGVCALLGILVALCICLRPKGKAGAKRALKWRKNGVQNGDEDADEAVELVQQANPYQAAASWQQMTNHQQPMMAYANSPPQGAYAAGPYMQPYQPVQGGYPAMGPGGHAAFQPSYSPYQAGPQAYSGGTLPSGAVSME